MQFPHEISISFHLGSGKPELRRVPGLNNSYWFCLNKSNIITLHGTTESNPIAQEWLAHLHAASEAFWAARLSQDLIAAGAMEPQS